MVYWNFDIKTKTLTIGGTGEMHNYRNGSETPWAGCDIEKVIVEDGITNIGDCSFEHCEILRYISISDSVRSIGEKAFASCKNLESITVPGSVEIIAENAFDYCENLTIFRK